MFDWWEKCERTNPFWNGIKISSSTEKKKNNHKKSLFRAQSCNLPTIHPLQILPTKSTLRQKGSSPELLNGLSEQTFAKNRKRAHSNCSDKSDGSTSSSSVVEYEDLRPAILLIARSTASWLRLEIRKEIYSVKQCLQHSSNILTSAAANTAYFGKLGEKQARKRCFKIFRTRVWGPESSNRKAHERMQ